jgi:mycoredoxin
VSDDYQPVEIAEPPIREEGSPWPHIAVYGAYWCSDTVRTRRFLNDQDIPYTYVDVDHDAQAAQQVMDWNEGQLSTPTVEIERRIVTEPSDEELAGILGLAPDSS